MVAILLGNGFEESEALVPADLLRRAGVKVALVGLDSLQVTGSHGITVTADTTLDQWSPTSCGCSCSPADWAGWRPSAVICGPRPSSSAATTTAAGWPPSAPLPPSWPTWDAGPPQRGVLPRHGGPDGLRRGAEGHPRGGDGHIVTGEAAGSAFPFGLKLWRS